MSEQRLQNQSHLSYLGNANIKRDGVEATTKIARTSMSEQRLQNQSHLSYLGNANIKRDGVEQEWTQDEINEYAKCLKDPVYFAKNYIKVISLDGGLVPFDLYPYQQDMFSHFNENRFSIVLACRQSGKSVSSVVYLLWYAIFHPEKTIAILANKGSTAKEMLARVTLALENLPFFLQPGCKTLNKTSVEFSNNSRIISASTSSSSIRGMSVNLLFLDEFALVQNDAEFYTSSRFVSTGGTCLGETRSGSRRRSPTAQSLSLIRSLEMTFLVRETR